MRTIISVNKWTAYIFHVILAVDDGEATYNMASRVVTTLAEARQVVEEWRRQHAVDEVKDNTQIQLSELMAGLEPPDFDPASN